MGNKLPQLPVEWLNKINSDAQSYMHSEIRGMISDEEIQSWRIQYAHADGQKLYACKLYDAEQKIKVIDYDNQQLRGELEGYKKACDELKEQSKQSRELLEDVLQATADKLIHKKIKTFLYGE